MCQSRAVLSDDKRRALYDAGMYDPLDDDQEDVEVSSSAIYSPMSGCAFGKLDGWQHADMSCAVVVSGIPRLRPGDGLAHGNRGERGNKSYLMFLLIKMQNAYSSIDD